MSPAGRTHQFADNRQQSEKSDSQIALSNVNESHYMNVSIISNQEYSSSKRKDASATRLNLLNESTSKAQTAVRRASQAREEREQAAAGLKQREDSTTRKRNRMADAQERAFQA